MSKYLDSLSTEKYQELEKKLLNQQNSKCYICMKTINLDLQTTNIDHIKPLANNGKDEENNFALTHEHCNKSKLDADLRIARVLSLLEEIKHNVESKNETSSLKDILEYYDGSKYKFKYSISNNTLTYSFSELNDNNIYSVPIFTDLLSKEQTAFIEVPIAYLYHDELINPRGINNSVSKLVKEFYKGNPQLHLSLGRIDNGVIKIFDGQHKAVAQLLLGSRKLVIRLFINPDVDRLIETNTNAGSKLKQIAFDKSIVRQLHTTLYNERIREYQKAHNLNDDDYSFSEQNLVDYFKGDRGNIKSYIINSMKHQVTHSSNNQLLNYIDFEGKGKELPISYSSFEKTFLSLFINSKKILSLPINYREDEGENPRLLEHDQLVNLCNIIAEEIYINKFSIETGVYKIEQKIKDGKDSDITDDHIMSFRISKEEIMVNWLKCIQQVIKAYFSNTGILYDEECLFQQKFPDQLWNNIRNFVKNLSELPLWRNRALATTIFAGKSNYEYWAFIFREGKTQDGVEVLAQPINYIDMIRY